MRSLLCVSILVLGATSAWAQSGAVGAAPEKFRVYLGTGKNIYRTVLDLKDGALSKAELAAELANPSFVAIHPNNRFLYSVSELNKGSIVAYAIDASTGALTQLNAQPAGGGGPCHVVVDRSGKVVLAANYGSGSCTSIPIRSDGSLGEPASVHQHQGKSINPGNQQGPHAHSINVDKANQFAFCADLGIDKIMVYRLDADTGKLTPNDPPAFATPPGTGPRHFAFHPDGKTAFINGEINMTLIACDYDAAQGVLKQKQIISTLPREETRKKGSTAEVVVHPSGKFVYVSNRDPFNSIAIFSIDSKSGELKAVGHETRGVKTPRNFAIEPTGRFMLVANQSGKSVISFSINQETGELTPTSHMVEVAAPVCVRFVPLTN